MAKFIIGVVVGIFLGVSVSASVKPDLRFTSVKDVIGQPGISEITPRPDMTRTAISVAIDPERTSSETVLG